MARVEGNEGLAKEFVGGATITELAEKYDLTEMRIAVKLGSIHIAKLSDEKKAELAGVKADKKKFSQADVEAAKAEAIREAREEFEAELNAGKVSTRDTNDTGQNAKNISEAELEDIKEAAKAEARAEIEAELEAGEGGSGGGGEGEGEK